MANKVRMTASEITDKWVTNMKNSVSNIQKGIDRMTVNPMALAAAQVDKYIQNITAAKERWVKSLLDGSLAEWKSKTKSMVAQRLSGGVENARSKHQKFAAWLVERQNQILPEIEKMPSMTLEDNLQRMTQFVRLMAEKKYKDEQ